MAYRRFPSSYRARLMRKKTTKQSLPKRKLPKGYSLVKKKTVAIRGGWAVAPILRTGLRVARRTAAGEAAGRLAQKLYSAAEEKGTELLNEAASKAQRAAEKALHDATDAFRSPKEAPSPPTAYSSDMTVVTGNSRVTRRPYNNAIVPDKSVSIVVNQGRMTKRESKFYTKWPKQKLLIYQSKTQDRLLHTVSPGSKSFYGPFWASAMKLPTWVNVPTWRKGVEVNTIIGAGIPTTEPPFLTSNSDYGTCQGGLDFNNGTLTLGTWADYASCISALAGTALPGIPSDYRVGGNYKLNFGIPQMKLDFHIENMNSFFPANFTVQVHEFKGSSVGTYQNNTQYHTPLDSILNPQIMAVPGYARAFTTVSTALVANDPANSVVPYFSELGLLANASTFGSNVQHARNWKIISSNKIKITAGGRLQVSLTLDLPPINFLEYLSVDTSLSGYLMRNKELHVTILAAGTEEVIGDVYFNGVPKYSAQFATNPVQYSVSNVKKQARVYAPQLNLAVAGTPGFEAANVQFATYVAGLTAFGESKITQFVPEGQYDIPFVDVVPLATVGTSIGQKLVIPLLTDQVPSSAQSRLQL